jgi:hypothetical protein
MVFSIDIILISIFPSMYEGSFFLISLPIFVGGGIHDVSLSNRSEVIP